MPSLTEKDIEVGSSSQEDSQHEPEIVTPEHEDKAAAYNEAVEDDDSEYITGVRLYLIILGLCMAVLLIGLVRCSLLEVVENNNLHLLGQRDSSHGILSYSKEWCTSAESLGCTNDYHCVQFSAGCRLVRICFFDMRVSFPAASNIW